MRNILKYTLFSIFLLATSCQSVIVAPNQPLKDKKIELYQKYNIQTMDGKRTKVKVLRIDDQNIYGRNNDDQEITISKTDIREVRKFNLLASLGIGAAAVLALLLIPVT